MHNALATPWTCVSANVLTIPWTHVCAHWWSPLPGVCDIGCWKRVRKSPQQPQPDQSGVATPAPDSFLVPLPYPFLENRHCLDLEIPYSRPFLLSPLRAYKNWDLFPLEVDCSTPAWDMSHPQSSGFPRIKPHVVCIKLGLLLILGCSLLSWGLSEGLLGVFQNDLQFVVQLTLQWAAVNGSRNLIGAQFHATSCFSWCSV